MSEVRVIPNFTLLSNLILPAIRYVGVRVIPNFTLLSNVEGVTDCPLLGKSNT